MNEIVADPAYTRGLTVRQERFAYEYVKDGNATQAAIRAGYSETSAARAGCILRKDPNVAFAIEALRADQRMGLNLTVERVRKEMARIAFANPRNLIDQDTGKLKDLHSLSDDDVAVIASIENEELYEGTGKDREHVGTLRKVKLWDKGRALELAAKTLGMVREQASLQIGRLTIVIED